MKYLVLLLCLTLTGCAGEAAYTTPPPGALTYGSGPVPVDPDKFVVDPTKYPVFKASRAIKPPATQYCWPEGCTPIEMTDILPTDVWTVTHLFKGLYMIESKEYQERTCRLGIDRGGTPLLSNTCHSPHLFAIYIDPTGNIAGGWQLLPGPDKLFAERDVYLDPDPDEAKQWPADFNFSAQPSDH